MSRVLIVEDEAHLADGLQFNIQAEGHSARVASDGEAAISILLHQQEPFDAMVLDVMLPGKDGFAVAAELRAAKNFIPILMLTARGRPEDVLKGFASGADDYLAKPFELPILLARLQGLLRRGEWMRQPVVSQAGTAATVSGDGNPSAENEFGTFSFAGRMIDFGNLELRAGKTTTHLTLMESELLRHLVRNRGRVVSRKSILEEVWGLREDTDTRAIDNFIVRLRRYLEDNPSRPKHLLTVRGVGYRFETDAD
ncbi:MAG TPA: response regulator transcription factor [Terriglobales bacterium]|jgi:DNA-binding response OmpR family regulator|nr:response regulator transcription factor [Terriglobales bacterium]